MGLSSLSGRVALSALCGLVLACSKKTEAPSATAPPAAAPAERTTAAPEPTGGDRGVEPTAAPAESPTATAPILPAATPPSSATSVRDILRQSLNATVDNPERFETAPSYRLTLDIDYDLFTYRGSEALHYINAEKDALTELNFLVYPNSKELASSGVKNVSVKNVRVDSQTAQVEASDEILHIPLGKPLAPGAAVDVTMDFQGVIYRLPEGSSDMKKLAIEQLMQMVMGESGAAKGGYGVFATGDDIVSLGLWYPVLAAYDEQGWDLKKGPAIGDVSYFDVSNYEVTVSAPPNVTVLSTGVEVARTVEGDVQRTRFVAGAVREFTIEMSQQYDSASAFVDGVKLTSWYLKSDQKSGQAVLDYAKEALKLYNREFGPYPYTELDVVEAPLVGGAGGVEFPGIVTIGKMFYGTEPAAGATPDPMAMAMSSSKYIKDTLEFVVAHEVAHEWWNATVGSDSKRHPFVDEALANHSACFYFERVHGKEAADATIELQLKLPYQLARMVGANDRPVDLATDQFGGMMEYAAIVYGKGGLFFNKMRETLGDATYLSFVKAYYKKHAFGVATTEDLIGGLVQASRNPAETQMLADRWLKETHADEDIGDLKIATLLKNLLGDVELAGPIGKIVGLLDDKGAKELAKVVKHIISPDGKVQENVDWGAILKLAAKVLAGEDGDTGLLGTAGDFLTKNPDILKGGSTRDMLKGLAKQLAGGDKKSGALIDAADALLQLLGDGGDDGEETKEVEP